MTSYHEIQFPDLLFVITGGPGSGKTTLVNALADQGLITVPESGRQIIQDQILTSGDALPWSDPAAFAALMFKQEVTQYERARQRSKIVVFDRGIPDVIGYLNLMKIAVPDYMEQTVQDYRYNHHVFVMPPWPEIFEQDTERKQTLEEAVATYKIMIKTYSDYGYILIEIPLATVEKRVQFVIDQMRQLS